MSGDDLIRKDVINHIMCHGEVDVRCIERVHGIDFGAHIAADARPAMSRVI